jgi:large subunit ribosomal protein L35
MSLAEKKALQAMKMIITHPMRKTNKSMIKRFKVTGGGKLMHRSPGARHLLRHKTTRQLHSRGRDRALARGMSARIMKCIAVGL